MFAKEGYPTMALVTAVSAVIIYVALTFLDHWISYLIVTTVFILWAIVIYFFRDPERTPQKG